MKLHTDLLPEYFTIATPANSHYTKNTNCFNFVDRESDLLVVTIGDSWTWGADLDPNTRLQQVYGNIISEEIDADWLNLSQSGANNFFIAERAEELSNIITNLHYKKIYLICTFTETGRSFNSHHDVYIDYVSWFQQNNIDKFLEFLNAECYNRICTVASQHNMILWVGTNFVDPIGFPADATAWFRQLGIVCDVQSCVGHTGATKLSSVEQFVDNHSDFKEWFARLVELSVYTDSVCRSSALVNAHPTPAGHKVWANCILESIK